jgi:hypothetical protein
VRMRQMRILDFYEASPTSHFCHLTRVNRKAEHFVVINICRVTEK